MEGEVKKATCRTERTPSSKAAGVGTHYICGYLCAALWGLLKMPGFRYSSKDR